MFVVDRLLSCFPGARHFENPEDPKTLKSLNELIFNAHENIKIIFELLCEEENYFYLIQSGIFSQLELNLLLNNLKSIFFERDENVSFLYLISKNFEELVYKSKPCDVFQHPFWSLFFLREDDYQVNFRRFALQSEKLRREGDSYLQHVLIGLCHNPKARIIEEQYSICKIIPETTPTGAPLSPRDVAQTLYDLATNTSVEMPINQKFAHTTKQLQFKNPVFAFISLLRYLFLFCRYTHLCFDFIQSRSHALLPEWVLQQAFNRRMYERSASIDHTKQHILSPDILTKSGAPKQSKVFLTEECGMCLQKIDWVTEPSATVGYTHDSHKIMGIIKTCGHIFCDGCMQTYKDYGQSVDFKCPACRHTFNYKDYRVLMIG